MTNNDILRRIRYIFDYNDSKMRALFALSDHPVTRDQISDWLKKDDDPVYQKCSDIELALFLNGLITDKRGKKEGPQPEPEQRHHNSLFQEYYKQDGDQGRNVQPHPVDRNNISQRLEDRLRELLQDLDDRVVRVGIHP